MEIIIGSWAIPALITTGSFVAAFWAIPEGRGDYNFSPLIGCATVPLAGCVSLAAWLVWALF